MQFGNGHSFLRASSIKRVEHSHEIEQGIERQARCVVIVFNAQEAELFKDPADERFLQNEATAWIENTATGMLFQEQPCESILANRVDKPHKLLGIARGRGDDGFEFTARHSKTLISWTDSRAPPMYNWHIRRWFSLPGTLTTALRYQKVPKKIVGIRCRVKKPLEWSVDAPSVAAYLLILSEENVRPRNQTCQ